MGALGALAHVPFARPIGASFAGGRVAAEGHGGALLGVEGAWATSLPTGVDPSQGAWAFGVRAGWAFADGLAVHARYDDLGVRTPSSSTPLQLATVGLRYTVPFIVPLPFAEVNVGPAFAGGVAHFGASAGVGASLPLERHVAVELVGRDWLVPLSGELHQTLTVGLGLTVTFGSPGS